MTEAVAVEDLRKSYPHSPVAAVDGLSFSVSEGEVFGLLGPNGAGKSTTVGVLTTRVTPTGGHARVAGVDVGADPARARKALAVVSQRNNLDRGLDVRQNLVFHAAYHGVGRAIRARLANEILERMGLAEYADSRVDFMSGGQAQRVMIARALMHRPRVLFLDEPSTGLDPQSRLFVHDRVAELREQGVTVVLTTHDMDEAEKLCDRIGIIDHGRLIALDSAPALTRTLPGSTTITVTVSLGRSTGEQVQAALSGVGDVERVEKLAEGQYRLYAGAESDDVLPSVLKALTELNCRITDLSVGTPSLEDVFIHLTGRELR